jgi:hypothetical protein
MLVLDESPDRLRLGKEFGLRCMKGLLYLLVFAFFAVGSIMLTVSVGPGEWHEGSRLNGVAAVLAGCLLLPLSLLTFLVFELEEGRDTEYQFDRRSGELRVVQRLWLLRSRQSQRYSLADFIGVRVAWETVVVDYNYGAEYDICDMELQMRSGKSLKVYRDTPKRGEDITAVAEAIARFLGLPLTVVRNNS